MEAESGTGTNSIENLDYEDKVHPTFLFFLESLLKKLASSAT